MIDEFHKLAATAAIKNMLEGKAFQHLRIKGCTGDNWWSPEQKRRCRFYMPSLRELGRYVARTSANDV